MDYNLTKQERETVIVFNEAEKTAEVYTCSQSMIRKMDALVAEYDEFSVAKQDDISKTYILPKKYVKIRKPSNKRGIIPPNFKAKEGGM